MLGHVLDRHRARYNSQRVHQRGEEEEEDAEHLATEPVMAVEETRSNSAPDPPNTTTNTTTTTASNNNNNDTPELTTTTTTTPNNNNDADDDASSTGSMPSLLSRRSYSTDSNDSGIGGPAAATTTTSTIPTTLMMTQHLTLQELEEERELARRRSSACVMFAVFLLFRLWMEAIAHGDFGLLLLALVGTSWTARWIRHQRDREDELDRRIAHYLEQQQQNQNSNNTNTNTLLDRNDLRMLSFQAQLALAIMESQRHVMQGGFGHPDGIHGVGVSESAKAQWEHFAFSAAGPTTTTTSSKTLGYGSVSQHADEEEGLEKKNHHDNEEEPHCSICLCEYEQGEKLVKLPCGHVYHDECIASWTSNHVKCPLCNFDLETAPPLNHTTMDSIV